MNEGGREEWRRAARAVEDVQYRPRARVSWGIGRRSSGPGASVYGGWRRCLARLARGLDEALREAVCPGDVGLVRR